MYFILIIFCLSGCVFQGYKKPGKLNVGLILLDDDQSVISIEKQEKFYTAYLWYMALYEKIVINDIQLNLSVHIANSAYQMYSFHFDNKKVFFFDSVNHVNLKIIYQYMDKSCLKKEVLCYF